MTSPSAPDAASQVQGAPLTHKERYVAYRAIYKYYETHLSCYNNILAAEFYRSVRISVHN